MAPLRSLRSWIVFVFALGPLTAGARAQSLHAEYVTAGFDRPTCVTSVPADPHRMYVTEQRGRIRVVRDGVLLRKPFLDVSAEITPPVGETGLLSVAFHPDYASNGRFFVFFTDLANRVVLREYRVGSDPEIADPASGVDLLPPGAFGAVAGGHCGGEIQFGLLDGMLYAGLGDGGTATNAQLLSTHLGKILRFDVDAPAPHVPLDNPFADPSDGIPDAIWAFGLRQPWRFSFDRLTGDLWIGDVGQAFREELDFQPPTQGMPGSPGYQGGRNYGWRCLEGTTCASIGGCPCSGQPFVPPIHDYGHLQIGGQAAVIGGYVYRGATIPWLQGAYVFADFAARRFWTLRYDGTSVTELVDRTNEMRPAGYAMPFLTSFGEDAAGEIHMVYLSGPMTGIGTLYRIAPGAQTCPTPVAECIATPNSTGSPAQLSLDGITCLSADYLAFQVSGVPRSTTGDLIAGPQAAQVPFGNGYLCIAQPVIRVAQVNMVVHGIIPFHALATLGPLATAHPWRFQFVFRDPAAGPGAMNATAAVAVTFAP